MKNFMEKITTDKEFQEKFIAYMHEHEDKVKTASEKIGSELNNFMHENIKGFAAENNIDIEFDQETVDKLSGLCRDSAVNLNENIIRTFENYK